MQPRVPSVAQVRLAVEGELNPALFLNHAIADVHAAVAHGIQIEREVRTGLNLSPEVECVRVPARGEILNSIESVVAAADGPIVGQADHASIQRTVADIWRHESALPRYSLQRFVVNREIEQRKILDMKNRPVS